MFGKNPVRGPDFTDGQTLIIQDVFLTIQGEGPLAGRPAIFIRVGGCNLRCTFCDTDFESNRQPMGISTLVDHILPGIDLHQASDLIVITGGEPLRQQLIPLLTQLLQPDRYTIQIETAGTLCPPGLPEFWAGYRSGAFSNPLQLVCSPKTPKLHPRLTPLIDAYKYILQAGHISPTDGLPQTSTQPSINIRHDLARPDQAFPRQDIYVQPMDLYNTDENLANIQACIQSALKYGYRISLQLHKLLNLP